MEQIDILSFIELLGFPLNRMLCLIFYKKGEKLHKLHDKES